VRILELFWRLKERELRIEGFRNVKEWVWEEKRNEKVLEWGLRRKKRILKRKVMNVFKKMRKSRF